ncbi:hypothetical protein EHS86_11170 [Erwinia amylovora]|uniref:Uncharacterized protein n=3 Tax=Erwinia amylovora TaxID=552 RepID=A0A831ESC4_ERWAM|nr:hypothetical protein AD997_01900 [Erwinia amylovora]EKV52698.1 hypothetical protein EaACW_3287 [Erwinia amylovora ACW56400]CBA23334.1 hypothetical protein predicted by Glimmer/Critica [Erwinia amylovora CFBP1430]CCO80126.1 hypothetical protein BN432_3356 [Erwinia amylovora Ea356]CCO83930.1 hypothetical protein BN433_3382 [Erwinia amylovora Ea266]CCO87693.1 hypothetical protein BN434_3333 [Erwinia amylovora CFBP 2585]CCO91483.1 hypothetical protein BN435_3340 [Erwinia amylovora 01SFR-BO]CC
MILSGGPVGCPCSALAKGKPPGNGVKPQASSLFIRNKIQLWPAGANMRMPQAAALQGKICCVA